MTEQEKLAREWAESVRDSDPISEKARAAAEFILDIVPPPTMADVEWDDEKHLGAGATDTNGRVWVMSQDDGGYINCIGLDMRTCGAPAEDLTPNGKRYKLVEVTEPDHPEVLETEEDYENAPEGTIIAASGWNTVPLVKRDGAWHRDRLTFASEEMAGGLPVEVLRWGWGE